MSCGLEMEKLKDFDIFICHRDYANKPEIINVINELKCVKIIAGKKKDKSKYFDEVVYLPASINEINNIVESSAAKREFAPSGKRAHNRACALAATMHQLVKFFQGYRFIERH